MNAPFKKAFSFITACGLLLFSLSAAAHAPFDRAALQKSSKNVCDYVARAYSNGYGTAIAARHGFFISKAGKRINVEQGWGGSCGGTVINVAGTPYQDPGLYGIDIARQSDCATVLALVPFRGKFYSMSIEKDIPRELVDPRKGPICSFQNKKRPYLAVDKDPRICKKFIAAAYPDNIDWSPVNKIKDGSANHEAGAPGGFATYQEKVTVRLGGKKMRFGYFYWSPTAAACSYWGIRAWPAKNDGTAAYKKINRSLEDLLAPCFDADAALKKIDGNLYIEGTGGRGYHHSLLEYANGKFNLVCKTNPGRLYRYSPIPLKNKKKE